MNLPITYSVRARMLANLGDYERFDLTIEVEGIAVTAPEKDVEDARMKALELAVKVQDDLINRSIVSRNEALKHGESRARYEFKLNQIRGGGM